MTSPVGFEARLERIEKIIARLESPSVPLDESLAVFEEGIGLLRLAAADLAAAESRIKVLSESGEGGFTLEDLKG